MPSPIKIASFFSFYNFSFTLNFDTASTIKDLMKPPFKTLKVRITDCNQQIEAKYYHYIQRKEVY